MSRRLLTVTIALTAMLVIAGCGGPDADAFIDEWAPRLAALDAPADTQGASPDLWMDNIWVRRFDSGEWIAIRATDPEYSHSARAFDATVFCDSTGLVQYDTARHVCAFDEVDALLGERTIEASGLATFYESLAAHGWELQQR